MGSDILTVKSAGLGRFDYWDAYVGGEKIKTEGLTRPTKQMSLPINDLH